MLKIELNKIAVTADGLFLGLVVRYGDAGPVRFAQVSVQDDVLGWQELQDLTTYLNRQVSRHMDRERDAEPWEALPGL